MCACTHTANHAAHEGYVHDLSTCIQLIQILSFYGWDIQSTFYQKFYSTATVLVWISWWVCNHPQLYVYRSAAHAQWVLRARTSTPVRVHVEQCMQKFCSVPFRSAGCDQCARLCAGLTEAWQLFQALSRLRRHIDKVALGSLTSS